MNTITEWVATLTEDYISNWANKGLVRRGKKLLDQQEPHSWLLTDQGITTHIDHYQQTLSGVGFDYLECSCPASGACHHQVCLLLGLASLESADNHPPPTTALPTPWLIREHSTRIKLLSKTAVDQAFRWMEQGIKAELETSPQALKATVYAKDMHQVFIPRAGGIQASTCSCKKNQCAHRALSILTACDNAGILDLLHRQSELTAEQKHTITQSREWLQHICLQGLNSLSEQQLSRGEALSTELRQADLPLPSRHLLQVVQRLRDEKRRLLSSQPGIMRSDMSRLYTILQAITSPTSLLSRASLAGVHRRQYQTSPSLELTALAAEQWQTLSGYRGYTLYFHSSNQDCFYTHSESRLKQANPTWSPIQAFQQAGIGETQLPSLLGKQFRLTNALLSQDNRITFNDKTQLEDIRTADIASMFFNYDPATSINTWLKTYEQDPFRALPPLYTMLSTDHISGLEFDRYLQQWRGQATHKESTLPVLLWGDEKGERSARRLNRNQASIKGLLGQWHLLESQLYLIPSAYLIQNTLTPCEPII